MRAWQEISTPVQGEGCPATTRAPRGPGGESPCHARIVRGGVEAAARRINVRYEGDEREEDFTQETAPASLILRLEPGELRTWDYADDEEA